MKLEKGRAGKAINRLLGLLTAVCVLTVPVLALPAYGTDDEEISRQFSTQFGWDQGKMDAYSWIGADGKEYTRRTAFERSYYEDAVRTTTALAMDLGIVTEESDYSGNALSIIAVALAEVEAGVTDEPMWSNNVKYNTWYYGRPVMGDAYPWCCAFISWCADQCGLIESGTFRKTAGCAAMRGYFNERGYDSFPIMSAKPYGGTEMPIPGDVIIWGANQHIALIVAVNEDSIETVEGNTYPRVAHQVYTKRLLQGNLATATIFRVQYPDNELTIFNFLRVNMSMPAASACGVVANIYCESRFDEHVLGDNGTSYGLCGWHLSRWDRLKAFCDAEGYSWEGLEGQLHYLKWELETYFQPLVGRLLAMPNSERGVYDAAFAWCHDFEIPQGYEFTTSNYRGNLAVSQFWPKYVQYA